LRFSSQIARLSLLTALIACASSGSGGSSRANPDNITRVEVRNSNASNAYELVSRLRPNWLRTPATGTISGGRIQSQSILVYLDRQHLEDLNALKTISADGIESIQWLEPSRVQTILPDVPSGPIAGAIVVKTRR
jgi:hypothetical protein